MYAQSIRTSPIDRCREAAPESSGLGFGIGAWAPGMGPHSDETIFDLDVHLIPAREPEPALYPSTRSPARNPTCAWPENGSAAPRVTTRPHRQYRTGPV